MSKETHCFKVGTSECIVVSDGTFAYPHPAQIFSSMHRKNGWNTC
jgi:hypothetical protein